MKLGQTFGKRYEKKYILKKDKLDSFMKENQELFEKTFAPDYFEKECKYVLIKNIYFDSVRLHSYRTSIEKRPTRHKLRIRTYAQDGVVEENLFFEVKSKEGKQTLKERIILKKDWIIPFLTSDDSILEDIIALNLHTRREDVLKTIKTIQYFLNEFDFRPVLTTSYKRYAYKLRFGKSFRMTMDCDLKFKRLLETDSIPVDYPKTIDPDKDIIIELKYKDKEILNNMEELRDFLGKGSGFSKYCFGVKNTQNNPAYTGKEKDFIQQIFH